MRLSVVLVCVVNCIFSGAVHVTSNSRQRGFFDAMRLPLVGSVGADAWQESSETRSWSAGGVTRVSEDMTWGPFDTVEKACARCPPHRREKIVCMVVSDGNAGDGGRGAAHVTRASSPDVLQSARFAKQLEGKSLCECGDQCAPVDVQALVASSQAKREAPEAEGVHVVRVKKPKNEDSSKDDRSATMSSAFGAVFPPDLMRELFPGRGFLGRESKRVVAPRRKFEEETEPWEMMNPFSAADGASDGHVSMSGKFGPFESEKEACDACFARNQNPAVACFASTGTPSFAEFATGDVAQTLSEEGLCRCQTEKEGTVCVAISTDDDEEEGTV